MVKSSIKLTYQKYILYLKNLSCFIQIDWHICLRKFLLLLVQSYAGLKCLDMSLSWLAYFCRRLGVYLMWNILRLIAKHSTWGDLYYDVEHQRQQLDTQVIGKFAVKNYQSKLSQWPTSPHYLELFGVDKYKVSDRTHTSCYD